MIKTYRYELKSKDQQEVHLPKGSLIKSVENKKDRPVLVYEVDMKATDPDVLDRYVVVIDSDSYYTNWIYYHLQMGFRYAGCIYSTENDTYSHVWYDKKGASIVL